MTTRSFLTAALTLFIAAGLSAQSYYKPKPKPNTGQGGCSGGGCNSGGCTDQGGKPTKPNSGKPHKPNGGSGGGGCHDGGGGGCSDGACSDGCCGDGGCAGGACDCAGQCDCGGGGQKGLMGLVLTDAQLAEAKSLISAAKGEISALQAKAQAAQKAFMEASKSGSATPEQLKELFLAAESARFDVKVATRKLHADIKALLTAEQVAQLDSYKARIEAFKKLLKA